MKQHNRLTGVVSMMLFNPLVLIVILVCAFFFYCAGRFEGTFWIFVGGIVDCDFRGDPRLALWWRHFPPNGTIGALRRHYRFSGTQETLSQFHAETSSKATDSAAAERLRFYCVSGNLGLPRLKGGGSHFLAFWIYEKYIHTPTGVRGGSAFGLSEHTQSRNTDHGHSGLRRQGANRRLAFSFGSSCFERRCSCANSFQ